jgi:hypothetical protein
MLWPDRDNMSNEGLRHLCIEVALFMFVVQCGWKQALCYVKTSPRSRRSLDAQSVLTIIEITSAKHKGGKAIRAHRRMRHAMQTIMARNHNVTLKVKDPQHHDAEVHHKTEPRKDLNEITTTQTLTEPAKAEEVNVRHARAVSQKTNRRYLPEDLLNQATAELDWLTPPPSPTMSTESQISEPAHMRQADSDEWVDFNNWRYEDPNAYQQWLNQKKN